MTRKRIKLLIGLTIALLALYICYRIFFWGTISTEKGNWLQINGAVYHSSQVKVRPGHYSINVLNPLKNSFSSSVTLYPFNKVELPNNSPTLTIEEIAKNADERTPYELLNIDRSKFFNDNTWLVISFSSKSGLGDGFTAIYNFTDSGWSVYNMGTGLGDNKLKTVAPEVYQYVVSN